MKVEVGKSYKLVRNNGESETVTIFLEGWGLDNIQTDPNSESHYAVRFTGEVLGVGHLEEIDELANQQVVAAAETARPCVYVGLDTADGPDFQVEVEWSAGDMRVVSVKETETARPRVGYWDVEVGKSYRFVRNDGAPDEIVTTSDAREGDVFVQVNEKFLGKNMLCCNSKGEHWSKLGRLVDLDEQFIKHVVHINVSEHQQAVVAAETKRPHVESVSMDELFPNLTDEDWTRIAAQAEAETKRPRVGYWDDEPGELERMRRVFATWDFRTGA